MSKLDKVLIQGIRSFGPEDKDAQLLKLQSPLTLILGQNGCGKTTIIECLKYAVTGDLPPGAKQGQSFVHDPKISRKIETHGKVMLQFTDMKADTILITRLMQLTQKAKKMEFKTRDATLSRIKPSGERADIGGRCADIDVEVTTALGVSKSILNNVIFCHQEESAWPLDESKKVKEKFDDIFDATKHNKYLENIRILRKSIMDDLKLLNNDIGHLTAIKEEVDSKRKQLQEAERRMNVNNDQIQGFVRKLEPIMDRLNLIVSREKDYNDLHTKKEKKKTELEGVNKNQRELSRAIECKFNGTIEELEEAIQKFQSEMNEKEVLFAELNSKLRRLEKEDNKLQEDITRRKVEKGKLQSELKQQDERIDARNKLLGRLVNDLEIQGISYSSAQPAEDEVLTTLGKINRKMKDQESSFELLRSQMEKEEQELQNKIDELRDEKVTVEQQVSMKSKQIQETRNDIKRIKNQIEEVNLSAIKLQRIEDKLKRTVRDLEEVEKSLNADEVRNEIETANDKQLCLQEQLEEVDREVELLQQQSSIQAELDIQRASKSAKESEIRKLKNKHEDTLNDLLKNIPEEGIKYELKSCIDRLSQEIRNMNDSLKSKQREVVTLESNRRHQKEMLKKKEDDLRAKEESLYEACGDQDYDEVVKKIQESVQNLQDQKGTLSSSEYMFKGYIQKLQQTNPCCPLCHRGFDVIADAQDLVRELNSKIREVPTLLRDSTSKLETEQRKYKKLLELKPAYEDISILKNTEIPRLRNELEQTEKKLGTLRRDVENLELTMSIPQADKERAERIQPDVVLLDQHHKELKKLQQEFETLEAKLPPGSSSKSMEQALNEQKQMRLELNKARNALENARRRLCDHNERIQKLKEEKNRLTEERLKIESGVQQRKQLEDRQSELQALELVLGEEVENLREKLINSKRQHETAVQEKDAVKAQNGEELRSKQKVISDYQKRVDEIQRYQNVIKEFEQRGVNRKLTELERSLQDIEETKDSLVHSIQDVKVKIGDVNNELSKQQVKKRDLDDNLKLRTKEKEAAMLEKEIKNLEQSLGDLKFETLLKEKRELIREEEKITREKNQAEGMLKEQQTTIVNLRHELKKPVYKDAERKYLEKVVRKKVTEATSEDLLRYYKATEWAMLHFHKERMMEINTIIRELWRQIYRGNDIDYIEIKTDIPEDNNSDKRRNYNYRVVQMKNDVEIDMRGRCSAGQKVLASLIIRMALAETFSANCGMLALDEPTTNLDRENIESLSTALADIVNSRMVQKNFQLLIITHDEEFLDRLSKVEKLEHYFRVSRNEHGKSVIERHRVDR